MLGHCPLQAWNRFFSEVLSDLITGFYSDLIVLIRFVVIEGVNPDSITPDSIGFQSAIYHAANNLLSLLESQQQQSESNSFGHTSGDMMMANLERNEEIERLREIIGMIKQKVLNSSKSNLDKRYGKWKVHSTEADNLESNRIMYASVPFTVGSLHIDHILCRSPHGEWWMRMMRYIDRFFADEFVNNLRQGVQQGYSTKFIGWSQHVLRVNNLQNMQDLERRLRANLQSMNVNLSSG